MALDVEDILDGGVGREKSLSRSGVLEALHLALSWTGRLMRILGATVRPTVDPMTSFDAEFSSRSGVGREFVSRHPLWDESAVRWN
jgi:hypothetical protein